MTSSGTDLGAVIDQLRSRPDGADELAALLSENLPLYAGRSAAEMDRLRGYLLAAFADTGLPESALTYVLESLEMAQSADEVAGAAIALRGLQKPSVNVGPALLRALENLGGTDATVTFESYRPVWPYAQPTTALTEVVRTIGALGRRAEPARGQLERLAQQSERFSGPVLAEMRRVLGRANGGDGECSCDRTRRDGGCACEPAVEPTPDHSCCAGMTPSTAEWDPGPIRAVLEDQDGRSLSYEGFFHGKPSVVTFFYTRCDNPYKCSSSITKLAALQRLVERRGLASTLRLAAITYDPDFDLPHRLRLYGQDRGMRFSEDARFLRVTSGFQEIRERFDLGVNYGASTVNRHRSEVFVLSENGDVATSFTRVQWDVEAVLRAVEILLPRSIRPESVR